MTNELTDKITYHIVNKSNQTNIRLPKVKSSDIIVGKSYIWYKTGKGLGGQYVIIKIEHVRSGVVFYKENDNLDEDYFPIGSLMSNTLYPTEYIFDMNPKYYNIIDMTGSCLITNSFVGYDESEKITKEETTLFENLLSKL